MEDVQFVAELHGRGVAGHAHRRCFVVRGVVDGEAGGGGGFVVEVAGGAEGAVEDEEGGVGPLGGVGSPVGHFGWVGGG